MEGESKVRLGGLYTLATAMTTANAATMSATLIEAQQSKTAMKVVGRVCDAARSGDVNGMREALIGGGGSVVVDGRNEDGMSALMIASQNGHVDCVRVRREGKEEGGGREVL